MYLEYESKDPVYGVNYRKGYIGFGYGSDRFVSKGIAYFTRLNRLSDVKVSHALIVTGPDSCIEAGYKEGVHESSLSKYFNDDKYQIFFRRPCNLNAEIASALIETAKTQIGCKYDKALIASHAINGSYLGRVLNRAFGNNPDLMLSKLMNSDDRWVCSELIAYAMDSHDEYRDKGILAAPNETIDPQELFEDSVLFDPWHMEIKT